MQKKKAKYTGWEESSLKMFFTAPNCKQLLENSPDMMLCPEKLTISSYLHIQGVIQASSEYTLRQIWFTQYFLCLKFFYIIFGTFIFRATNQDVHKPIAILKRKSVRRFARFNNTNPNGVISGYYN